MSAAIWYSSGSRRDLLELAEGGHSSRPPHRLEGFGEVPTAADVGLVWTTSPEVDRLPSYLLVEERVQKEFFAWSSTYVPRLWPLTAYCRVIDPKVARSFEALTTPPRLDKLENVAIGAIIGEAIGSQTNGRSLSSIVLGDCEGTYSFVMARALALGWTVSDAVSMASLERLWHVARSAVSRAIQPEREVVVQLHGLWSALTTLHAQRQTHLFSVPAHDSDIVAAVVREALESGNLTPQGVQAVLGPRIEAWDVLRRMKGTREERVLVFERFSDQVVEELPATSGQKAAAVGLLASLVSPGTLEHVGLVSKYSPKFPTVFLWYGAFAGLTSTQPLGGSMGFRLLRDITAPASPSERPRADIAALEVEFTLAGGPPKEIIGEVTEQLRIEIWPFVTMTARRPQKTDPASREPVDSGQLVRDVEELRTIVERLYRRLGRGEPARPRYQRRR